MGLDIIPKHSEITYHRSYSALHLVRRLAFTYMNIPKSVIEALFCRNDHIDVYDYNMYCRARDINKEKLTITPTDLYNLVIVGYKFPNLLFHSDCEGSYTVNSSVMQETNWETGNIYGLNDELTLLYNHFKAMNITEVEGFHVLSQLQQLVEDECRYDDPVIEFH